MSASDPSPAARAAGRRHRDRGARRVRKALAPTRAGLGPVLDRLEPQEAARLAALHEAWLARTLPADAAERAALDELVLATARRQRLARLELRALEAAERAALPVPDDRALGTLRLLARLRGRLARDLESAREELIELRAGRPALPVEAASPAQLLWLAERILEGRVEAPPAPEAMAARLLWQAERRPVRLRRPAPTAEPDRAEEPAPPAEPAAAAPVAAHAAPEPPGGPEPVPPASLAAHAAPEPLGHPPPAAAPSGPARREAIRPARGPGTAAAPGARPRPPEARLRARSAA